MKKLFGYTFLFFILINTGYSQIPEEEVWISRIRTEDTGIGTDSTGYYSRVIVEINTTILSEGMTVRMIIGSIPGGNDIFENTVQYSGGVFTGINPVCTVINGTALFVLGNYIIPDNNFFIDAIIQ